VSEDVETFEAEDEGQVALDGSAPRIPVKSEVSIKHKFETKRFRLRVADEDLGDLQQAPVADRREGIEDEMRPLPDLREVSREELEREIDALEEAVIEARQVGGL